MSDAASYTLKHDITLTLSGPDGVREEVRRPAGTVLPLRRLKAKDLRSMDAAPGAVSASLTLIAKMTGLPMVEVDELDAEDFAALAEKVEGFLPPGQPTGETRSGT